MDRLNEQIIRKLKPPDAGYKLIGDAELPGFGVRITANGVRSFILTYTTKRGRQRRMTIGRWPTWTATAAREKAKALKRRVDDGEDPMQAEQQLRRDPTFGEIVTLYLDTEASKQKGYPEYKRLLEKEAVPKWKNTRAADVRRRDVIELIEKKAETAPIVANRLFELVRRVYNFGIRRDLVETNPCTLVRKPGEERSKDRVLSADEIRTLWTALDGPGFSSQTAAALRLVLVTAARPGEVSGLRRNEIDGAWWTLPSERSKNRLAHRVYLTRLARWIIKALPSSSYVFPSPRPGRPIHRNALAYSIRRARAQREDAPPLLTVDDFSPHDLRRTAASHMAAAGVERFIIRRVLNHVEPGVTKVYDRYGYDNEKKAALNKWTRELLRILRARRKEASR